MAYKDFYNDFNKGLCNASLFFYGAEDYLIDWAIKLIVDKYVEESYRSIDYQILDGESCKALDIIAAGKAYSMFSERRVIIVKNFAPIFRKESIENSEELLEFCSSKQDSSIVVFALDSRYADSINSFGKKLIKACSSYEFSKLDRAELQSFVSKRVRAAGKLLGRREFEFLLDISGYYNKEGTYDLARLDSDLAKITGACEADTISTSLIEELLVGEEERYVFVLIDAIMNGDKTKAMELAETIIREDDGAMAVLALLGKQFEIMYDALELSRQGLSVKEMSKLTGVNEFRFKRAFQAAREFNSDTIKDILIRIYNIDRDIKAGAIDKDIAFELLLVSI